MQARHVEALTSFLDNIAVCDDAGDLRDLFEAASRTFGVRYFHYYTEPLAGLEPRAHVISTIPKPWIERFVAMDYSREDVWSFVARCRNAPIIWSEISASLRLNGVQKQMIAEGNDAGLYDGLQIPIHDSHAIAFVCLSTDEPGWRGAEAIKRHYAVLTAMAYAFHLRAAAILGERLSNPGESARRLSPRENEVLQWVASGKTDWEVGRILNITERAVKFHVAGARHKLQASNRAHAVAIALSSGLIDAG